MLALAGGAAMAGRRRNLANATDTVNPVGGVDQIAADAALKSAPVVRKDVLPEPKPVVKKPMLGNTRLSRDGVTPGMVLNARRNVPGYGTAVAPPSILNPYQTPRVHVGRGRKDGGRIGAKHGGRVTGIAKRGFGRALMKGKK